MRLRFGRLSFPILVILAAIFGAVYYAVDNMASTASSVTVNNLPTQAPVPIVANPTAFDQAISVQATAVNPPRTFISDEIPLDTKIFIPTASIWSDVIQAYLSGGNWDITNLRSNAGHLQGTSWVDEPGNTVISGHVELSSGLPGIFATLENVQIGDTITVTSEGVDYFYTVTETYYTVPTDLTPLRQTVDDRLTLITCNSYDIVTNAYRERLIIVAERVT
ncbi:MAG: sortase [Chloroflexota bacterium]